MTATLHIPFRLPLADWPRATLESDPLMAEGRLVLDEETLLRFERGAVREFHAQWRGHAITLRLPQPTAPDPGAVELSIDGTAAVHEDRLSASPSRSAWLHAVLALAASFFGFVASYLYLDKAQMFEDAWAMKMGIHTAGWHLLLTLTLFPASVWGQRVGIRAVQFVSLVFFLIHAGMALANATSPSDLDGPWIALFNALSGLVFLACVVYGQRAHRDMNPERALTER